MLAGGKYSIPRRNIAASFAQAAETYDEYATLQREVADSLLASISVLKPKRVLDLGSGTGYCTEELKRLFPDAVIISLDIAEGMLAYAKAKGETKAVCADAESLPFAENSFDLIVSSLAIQWCVNYGQLFSELDRVLKKNASIYLSTFGPSTLEELKLAWGQVDDYVHVNRFVSKRELEIVLRHKGFAEINIERQPVERTYESLRELTRELKSIGAHNMNKGQAQGLGGRQKVLSLKKHFESAYIPGFGIPVTYELYYLYLRKSR